MTGTGSQGSREIAMTRVLNARRELVWKVWTDPEHIAKWWGPDGFTNTIQTMDVRPGGDWIFVMHGPDGVDYLNEVHYDEVVEPERIVYSHGPTPKFQVIVTFREIGEKTEMNWRMIFETVEDRRFVAEKHGAVEGLKQTIGHLEEYLSTQF